jgi:hypothetical protein
VALPRQVCSVLVMFLTQMLHVVLDSVLFLRL